MAGSLPVIGSASRASQSGSRGSKASRGSKKSSGGSSASSAKGAQKAKKARTCQKCPKWRYQVGARHLGGVPMVYTYYHLFVIAWNRGGGGASGLKMTFSAFPSRDGNPSIWGAVSGASTSDSSKKAEEGHRTDPKNEADMGYIKPEIAPDYYGSGEVAAGNKFVTLRDTNANYVPKLLAASAGIASKRIKYEGTGPNSNSYAMSIVRKAKLPDRKPGVTAPGSGMQLI